VRIAALPSFKSWIEARGGKFPEELGGETHDELLLRLRRIRRALEEASSQLVDNKCDVMMAILHHELQAFSKLQTLYFRAELEGLLFEIRRVTNAADYKKFMRGFFFNTVGRTGLVKHMVGMAFSPLQGLSEAGVRRKLKRGDFPVLAALPVVKASVRHFKRTFQQPLQDVVDGKCLDGGASRCCLFWS
jgi:hypothetical protein